MSKRQPKTFGSVLGAMKRDLQSIVRRMNIDESYDVANAAQKALVAVDAVLDAHSSLDLQELEWSWKPEPPERDDG